LLFESVGFGGFDVAPTIDRPGGTRSDTRAASVADVKLDYIVACIVLDRSGRAGLFTRVASDANRRVDQMLKRDSPRRCAHMLLF